MDTSELIDRLCDRFEAEWRAGLRPRLETFLARAPVDARAALFRAIVPVELELLQREGKSPNRDEYLSRFPADAAAIAAMFS